MINKEDIIIISEKYRSIVTINNAKAGETAPIIIIRSPKRCQIEIIGTNHVKHKIDASKLIVKIFDKDGNIIDLNTDMIITHERSDGINQIVRLRYHDANMVKEINVYDDINLTKKITVYRPKTESELCRFKNTIILDEDERLIISVVNTKKDIGDVKFTLSAIVRNKD